MLKERVIGKTDVISICALIGEEYATSMVWSDRELGIIDYR